MKYGMLLLGGGVTVEPVAEPLLAEDGGGVWCSVKYGMLLLGGGVAV